jgi:ribosomal protein L7Ae-like RNA K-turn-binding protein
MLGLATKARYLVSGGYMTERAIKSGTAKLVIVAEDASANTRKSFSDACNFYQVPIYFFGISTELGQAMGKEARVSLALTDTGFAVAVRKLLDEEAKI